MGVAQVIINEDVDVPVKVSLSERVSFKYGMKERSSCKGYYFIKGTSSIFQIGLVFCYS